MFFFNQAKQAHRKARLPKHEEHTGVRQNLSGGNDFVWDCERGDKSKRDKHVLLNDKKLCI